MFAIGKLLPFIQLHVRRHNNFDIIISGSFLYLVIIVMFILKIKNFLLFIYHKHQDNLVIELKMIYLLGGSGTRTKIYFLTNSTI